MQKDNQRASGANANGERSSYAATRASEKAAARASSQGGQRPRGRGTEAGRAPIIRKVNGYLVYMDEVLGEGQYGKVCKASLASEAKLQAPSSSQGNMVDSLRSTDKSQRKQVFACKIIEIENISQEDMDCIQKEVRLHSMIKNDYSVRLFQTIKTSSNIYMIQELCNGFDLGVLLKMRKRLTQAEARQIMHKVVQGIKVIWELGIIHRDMKLANILLHFPDYPQLETMTKSEKRQFLAKVDLTKVNFAAKISDFGLSTIIDGSTAQLSICGTPLYSSPQLLKKKGYSNKVDTWALGVMLYELLMGVTPFHSFEMKELMAKINEGRYSVTLVEPLSVECALFLTQCLQANEDDRIDMDQLAEHPFIDLNSNPGLVNLDQQIYEREMKDFFGDIPKTDRSTAAEQYVKHQQRADIEPVFFSTKDKEQWRILEHQLQAAKLSNSVDIPSQSPNDESLLDGLGSARKLHGGLSVPAATKSDKGQFTKQLTQGNDTTAVSEKKEDDEDDSESVYSNLYGESQDQNKQAEAFQRSLISRNDTEKDNSRASNQTTTLKDEEQKLAFEDENFSKQAPPPELYNIPPDQLNSESAMDKVKTKKRGKVRRFFNYIATKMCSTGDSDEKEVEINPNMSRIEKKPVRYRSSEYKKRGTSTMNAADEERMSQMKDQKKEEMARESLTGSQRGSVKITISK